MIVSPSRIGSKVPAPPLGSGEGLAYMAAIRSRGGPDVSGMALASIDGEMIHTQGEAKKRISQLGLTAFDLVDHLEPALHKLEETADSYIKTAKETSHIEDFQLFRLRLARLTMQPRLIWPLLRTYDINDPAAKGIRGILSGSMYGCYSNQLKTIMNPETYRDTFYETPIVRGALNEATAGALLSRKPSDEAICLMSTATEDRKGVDYIYHAYNHQTGEWEERYTQVKSSDYYPSREGVHRLTALGMGNAKKEYNVDGGDWTYTTTYDSARTIVAEHESLAEPKQLLHLDKTLASNALQRIIKPQLTA